MEPFYYNHMNKNQQAVYRAMQQGLTNLSDEFQIPRLEGKDLSNVFFELRLDHPEIFWASGFKYKYYPDSPNLILIPEYLFDKGKIREHQKAMGARVEKLARPAMKLTELEKERYIHDFICEHVHYDKLKKPYSHEILGPLTQGVGVCEGIAKTVKALCDQLGLWCIVALSEADPARGIKYRHTWNVVRVGGQYYHLDATFDNSLQRGEKRYDYYNLDDGRLFRDHTPLVLPVPACTDGKRFYYRSVSLTKPEELEKRLAQALRKKQPLFVFHWRGGGLNRDTLQQLLALAGRLAAERGKRASCSVNFPQAVIQLEFSEAPQESITIQQANEAEEAAVPSE